MAAGTAKNKSSGKSILVFIVVFIYLVLGIQIFAGMDFPMKIDDEYDDTEIKIYDATGLIGDDEELRDSMEYFQNQTGITPTIFVDYYDNWSGYYESVEDYADDIYDKFISDGYHMAILCTMPKDDQALVAVAICPGDEAQELIIPEIKSDFIKSVDRRLEHGDLLSEALTVSIIHTADSALKDRVDPEVVGKVAIRIIVFTIFVVFIKSITKKASNNDKKVKCPRCGKFYTGSKTAVCPHCSAVITSNVKDKVHNDHVDHGSHHKEEIDSDEEWREHFFGKRTSAKPRLRGKFRYDDDDNSTFNDSDYE